MPTTRRAAAIAALALMLTLAGCSTEDHPTPTNQTTTVEDPYAVYQRIAPSGAPALSREDAQTRALLGCGQKWAPGTVDAALAEAYKDLCTPDR